MGMGSNRVRMQPESRRRARLRGLRLLAVAIAAMGATAASAQTVRVTPTLDARLTWTDNSSDTGSGSDGGGDFVLEIAPGVRVSRDSGRFSGALSARFRNLTYSDDSSRNTSFLALQGQGRGEIEAVDDSLFVDMDASIARTYSSAFGPRIVGDEFSTDNGNETRIWSLGPRFQFRLGDSARGSVRYRARWFQSSGDTLGDQRVGTWNAQLSDPSAFRLFGWGLDYERSDTTYSDRANRDVMEEAGRGTLFVNLSPQFRLRGIAGYETNDYGDLGRDSNSIYGGGFDWYPTDRTAISATVENRFFGTGYDLSISHRMPRSLWSVAVSRDVSSSLSDLAGGFVLDPLYQIILNSPALINSFPNLADRELAARQIYFALGGASSIRSNAYFVQRSATAAVSFYGVRNVLSFSLQRSDRSRLNNLSGFVIGDDFRDFSDVRTTLATVSFSHQLSGYSSLVATATRSISEGTGTTSRETRRMLYSLGLASTLGPRTTGSLTYRHQRADGDATDFTENSITAAVSMSF